MISEGEKARLQVGFKQAVRALNEDKVEKVFLSEDCDSSIKDPIEVLCSEKNVALFYVPTMLELGRMCEIEVKASCAVILK